MRGLNFGEENQTNAMWPILSHVLKIKYSRYMKI